MGYKKWGKEQLRGLRLVESVPCEVHGDDEEHLGCDV
jgi:hypothetical protein